MAPRNGLSGPQQFILVCKIQVEEQVHMNFYSWLLNEVNQDNRSFKCLGNNAVSDVMKSWLQEMFDISTHLL